jgi:hypothetical protein
MASYRVQVQVGALFRMGQGVHLDMNDKAFFLDVSPSCFSLQADCINCQGTDTEAA